MNSIDIALQRLKNQQVAAPSFETPAELVAWMGAVQAQDYLGALWAVGLRLPEASEADVEQALANGSVIRTWPMRGTLHFVAAPDIRWMLELMASRVVNATAPRHERQFGLDATTIAQSRDVVVRALQGGKQLTRDGVYASLEASGVPAGEMRGLHILGRLAQEGVICFGPRQAGNKPWSYLMNWAPQARKLQREAALAELTRRYFTSHGPATVQDFAWWSGLALRESRHGLHLAAPHLAHEVINGQTYWFVGSIPPAQETPQAAFLLPAFDEFLVSYKDRSAAFERPVPKPLNPRLSTIFDPAIIVGARVAGAWKRTIKKDTVAVTLLRATDVSENDHAAIANAASAYGRFLGKRVILE